MMAIGDTQNRGSEDERASPPWSTTTKVVVVVLILLALGAIVYSFREALPLLIIAFLIAYLLAPVVGFLQRRLRLPRTAAVALVYLALFALIGTGSAIVVPLVGRELQSIEVDVQEIADSIADFIARPVTIGNYTFELGWLYDQISGPLEELLSALVPGTLFFLFGVAESVVWVIIVTVLSFYLLTDAQRIGAWLESLVPPGYRYDFGIMRRQIDHTWQAFFRAQLLQCLVYGGLVGAITGTLGMRHALILGLIAALLEVVPRVGHTIAAIICTFFAFFAGSSYLPLSNFWFALVVLAVFLVLNEIDTLYILPNIVGREVHLPPVVIIVGIIIGASLAGILGILLAAPIISSLRVLGRYTYCKLLDLPPWPEEEEQQPEEVVE
nr:AI-2E family transporter [Anaerolineae bacterium]